MNCGGGSDPCETNTCACNYLVFSTCTGDPHINGSCQQSECDASQVGCSNVFTSCSDTPHACQQSECDGVSDGCANTYTGCNGPQYLCGGSDWSNVGESSGTVTSNAWHYVVAAYDGSYVTYYIDGVASTPIARTGNIASMPSTAKIGLEDGWTSQRFGGSLDEIRVSNAARSAAWTKFEYNNMSSGGNELTFGTEEDRNALSSSSDAGGGAAGTAARQEFWGVYEQQLLDAQASSVNSASPANSLPAAPEAPSFDQPAQEETAVPGPEPGTIVPPPVHNAEYVAPTTRPRTAKRISRRLLLRLFQHTD
jgi:hypothetical protein